jgi:hypothetical protein
MPAPDPDLENRWRTAVSNPFWVLEVTVDATSVEVERQGAKLLAMLAAGLAGADRYTSPLGEHVRTPDLVRQSLAELRDPDRRGRHEWWALGVRD